MKSDIQSFDREGVFVDFLRLGTLNGFSIGDLEGKIYSRIKKKDIKKYNHNKTNYSIFFGKFEFLIENGLIASISIDLARGDVLINECVGVCQTSSFEQLIRILDVLNVEWMVCKKYSHGKDFCVLTSSGVLLACDYSGPLPSLHKILISMETTTARDSLLT